MGIITKTAYEWCLDFKIRVLDLAEEHEEWYFTQAIMKGDFDEYIKDRKVKHNSMPRKTLPYLEYRMYGLVPYNISGIQAGIQFGHAVQEFNNMMIDILLGHEVAPDGLEIAFDKWRLEDKTFIICNGATTNENPHGKWYGHMQKQRDRLIEAAYPFAEFKEPDMNDTLTGFVFLVDERVFNRELYPDFVPTTEDQFLEMKDKTFWLDEFDEELEKFNERNYQAWLEKIGGTRNEFMREFADKRVLRLANN